MKLEKLCAKDLMSTKVVEAERHESLRTAVARMREHAIHGLLIAPDAPLRGYAILTGKDCIQVIADNGEFALDELCVEDAMTQPVITVPADLCVLDCVRLMRLTGVRTAPVVDKGKLLGVLTFSDILNAVSDPA